MNDCERDCIGPEAEMERHMSGGMSVGTERCLRRCRGTLNEDEGAGLPFAFLALAILVFVVVAVFSR